MFHTATCFLLTIRRYLSILILFIFTELQFFCLTISQSSLPFKLFSEFSPPILRKEAIISLCVHEKFSLKNIYTQEWNCCVTGYTNFLQIMAKCFQLLYQFSFPSSMFKISVSPRHGQHHCHLIFASLMSIKQYLNVFYLYFSDYK